jgi:hypothetical protein
VLASAIRFEERLHRKAVPAAAQPTNGLTPSFQIACARKALTRLRFVWLGIAAPFSQLERAPCATLINRAASRTATLDQCGVTLLAGKAVEAPFVGAAAACLAIAEVLRLLHQGPIHQLIDLDLLAVGHQTVLPQVRDFSAFNPGFTAIRA